MSVSNKTYPVSTVPEAFAACAPDVPLEAGDPRFFDLTKARGDECFIDGVVFRIVNADSPHRELITGHRGCGKSTELKRLAKKLEEQGFLSVYFDAEDALDLADTNHLDVLLTIAKAITGRLRQEKIEYDNKRLEQLIKWFTEETTTTHINEGSISIDALFRLLEGIGLELKAGGSRRMEIRNSFRGSLAQFRIQLIGLVNGARAAITRHGKYKDLVVIADGLEKVYYEVKKRQETSDENNEGQFKQYKYFSTHEELFVEHAAQLKFPPCHVIYTVPISLVYATNLANAWGDEPSVIPMVDISKSEGRHAFRDLMLKRVRLEEVLDNIEDFDRIIDISGGSLRDLFRVFRQACSDASDRISSDKVMRAINKLRKAYDRLLRASDMPTLIEIEKTGSAQADDKVGRLLHLRLLHEYENGDRRIEVHPAIRDNKRFRALLDDSSSLFESGDD
jgi:predicted ATPase